MAEERIDIVVTERGSRVVQRNLEDIGGKAKNSASSVDMLKKTLGTLGAAFGLQQLIKVTSAWTDLTSRVNIAAGSMANAGAVMDRLQKIARRTYADLGSTAEIYLSNSTALKELGYSTQQTLDFTESMTNALVISGAKAERAETVINALSKAMMEGKLSGMNWTTVLQQGGRVVEALAEGTGKSILELRKMAASGQLTSDTVFTALTSQLKKLQDEADGMPATVGDALVILKNRFVQVIGEMNEAGGFSDAIVAALETIADNMETIIKLTIGVAAGFVLIGGTAKAIEMARAAMLALNIAIAANPIGFLLTVLTSVLATLILFRDEINLGVDDVTTLGDVMRALGETIGAVFGGLLDLAESTFGPMVDLLRDWVGEVDVSVVGILRLVARGVDGYIGAWRGAINAVVALFKGLPAALGDLMTRALNVVLGKIQGFVNAAGQLLSTVTEFAGLGTIQAIDLQLTNQHEGAAKKLGEDVGSAFSKGFNDTNYAKDFLDKTVARAQEIGKERTAGGGEVADLDQKGPKPGTVADPAAAKAASKLKDALDSLVGSYDKVWAAQQEYLDGVRLLEQAEKAGLITAQRKAEVIELMKDQLKDALDPLAAINRELEVELQLLGLTAEARAIEQQVRAIDQDLRQQGVILGEVELSQLREKLQLIQAETAATETRNQVLSAILGPQKEFTEQLAAINELLEAGAISQAQANSYLVASNADLLQGTIEGQQAMLDQYNEMYLRIDEMRQADLISEQTAQQLKARVQAQITEQNLSTQRNFFSTLSGLSRSENKKLAAIGKAAAITTATIDGVMAVQKALASAPPPVNYALAAATGVVAAANVSQIMAQTPGFAFGGDFEVGGTGGTDSQMVAFRATPGEQVSIRTPTQERDEERQGGNGGQQGGGSSVRVINVIDPNMMQDYLTSSSGERVLLNVIERNAGAVRQVMNG